ncbi:MAG: 50S ribosomal protein L9 [Desulfovibrio sp.]
MKLILRADVDNLGSLGEIVTVKAGYGRNYLLPQGLAMVASDASLKQFELEKAKLQKQADTVQAEAQALADKIAATPVSITVRVGEGDKLYGSVTTTHIAEAMAEAGVELDRRKILLDEAIRSLGDFEIEIKLHPSVRGKLNLSVIKHGHVEEEAVEEAPAQEENATEEQSAEA